ncbi:hypothetical protein CDV36_014485, partial [Fusarium kuroshium]
ERGLQLSTILTNDSLERRAPQNPDFGDAIQTAINQFPGAVSRFQSAAGTAATSIPDIIKGIPGQVNDIPDLINGVPELIEELFPKNCSLGTGQFCIGLSNNISCSDLPLNMTDIIPQDIMKHLDESFDNIGSLNTVLARVTAPYLRDMLIIG